MLRRFIVLDMDRTLLDSHAYSMVMVDALAPELKPPARQLLAQFDGKNLDFLAYLMERTRIDYQTAIAKTLEYINPGDETLLMPGAGALLSQLAQSEEKFGVLTYGSPRSQALKLAVLAKITGLVVPAETTSVRNKSADFALNRWRPTKKAFYISAKLSGVRGGCYAERVILIDDKVSNLTTPHTQLITFHVPVEPTAEKHTLRSIAEYIRHTAR